MAENNRQGIQHFAATIAELTGIERPEFAEAPLSEVVSRLAYKDGKNYDRLFIYSPDCYAQWMMEKHPETIETVERYCPIRVPMHSMMPSVTPVCYSSIFTGALPEIHKIEKKQKLEMDSLFDSLIRAGKKVALISGAKNSMNVLWTDKEMDYYLFKSDEERLQIAKELIMKDCYDAIILYLCDYDTADHKYGPEADEAVKVFLSEAKGFEEISELIQKQWSNHTTLLSFITDHGCHACEPIEENDFDLGTHGSDQPCDQNILHFYGRIPKEKGDGNET